MPISIPVARPTVPGLRAWGGSGFDGRSGLEGHSQNVVGHRHVGAADVDDRIQVFQCLKLDLHVAITFAQLLHQHLAQILRRRAWLTASRNSFDGDADPFLFLQDGPLDICQLSIWRHATRYLFEEGAPVKATLNVIIEDPSGLDDVVEFSGTLLRGGHLRLDLGPFAFDASETALDLEGAIRVPNIIEEKNRAESH